MKSDKMQWMKNKYFFFKVIRLSLGIADFLKIFLKSIITSVTFKKIPNKTFKFKDNYRKRHAFNPPDTSNTLINIFPRK